MQDTTLNFDRLIAEKRFYEPGLHMPRHTDSHSRISITIDGSWEEKTDTDHHAVNSSSLLIKPRTAYHETTFGKHGCTIISIAFPDETFFPESFRDWNCLAHPSLSLIGIKLWTSLKNVRSDKELFNLYEQLLSTIRFLQEQKTPTISLQKAEQLLTVSAEDKKSIQTISDDVNLHRAYLSRSFKKQYACCPSLYARHTRLLTAIKYLSKPTMSLAGAAYSAEYADQSHMSRCIKKELGCTPAQLKKSLT